MKFSWAQGIIAAFLFFIAFLSLIVYKAMKQDISLIAPDYYQKELEYEQNIQSQKNLLKLPVKPQLLIDHQKVNIFFRQPIQHAHIHFYKPNSSKNDFKLQTTDSIISIPMQNKAKGVWKVKINFSVNDIEAYKEETIYIN